MSAAAANDFGDEAVLVAESDVEDAINGRLGWCPSCADFTTPDTALVDSGGTCVDCADDRVCGVVHAKRNGFITVAQ